MVRMETALTRAGYVVVNRGYRSRSAPIETLSDTTVGAALADPRLVECGTVHFVAHSLGGILVRSYFKRHRDDRLGRVVMLGPPNQGSEVVDRIGHWKLFQMLNGPAGGELGTDPASTPNRLGPVDFELGVIAGDRSINWINSLMIRGDDDGKMSVARTRTEGMTDHAVVHVTHPFLMKRKPVIDLTIRFLKSGRFKADTAGPSRETTPAPDTSPAATPTP
jgi:pimeloyl-ACP methyl ester carboxylesterase